MRAPNYHSSYASKVGAVGGRTGEERERGDGGEMDRSREVWSKREVRRGGEDQVGYNKRQMCLLQLTTRGGEVGNEMAAIFIQCLNASFVCSLSPFFFKPPVVNIGRRASSALY